MIRFAAVAAAFVSLFVFPWPVSAAFMLAASLFLPPAGIALGLVADLSYFVPGAALFPYLTVWGLACTLASLLVHRFVKTRIING